MQNYVVALVRHFEERPSALCKEYLWPRSKLKRKPYDVTFDDRCDLSVQFLHQPLKRKQIALKNVREWGGINGGCDSAIFAMSADSVEDLIKRGFTRVASWSKIITLHDPQKYLIYDARVAFCINFILAEGGFKDGFFPMPSSRNTNIIRALEQFKKEGVHFGRSIIVAGQDFYSAYLELVHTVAEKLRIPAWQVEMALFSRGPELAKSIKLT